MKRGVIYAEGLGKLYRCGLVQSKSLIDGLRWALTGHGQPVAGVLLIFFDGLVFVQRLESTVADRV